LQKIQIKSQADLETMRKTCQITRQILDEVGKVVQPGNSTEQINSFVHFRTLELGAKPSPLNYKGYPKSVCTSVNEVVCHGIPSLCVILKAGDIVNVDVTCFKDGFHGDSSRMFFVGGEEACKKELVELVYDTKRALDIGIEQVKPNARINDIGAAIQDFIEGLNKGYGIVREYTGHGIGRIFHEPPQIIHVGKRGTGEVMKPGMVFTIEPMINLGTEKTILSSVDGWTVRTADGKHSAQWEHTVAVVENGVEILT
jgi:methionyl aminopeptidase